MAGKREIGGAVGQRPKKSGKAFGLAAGKLPRRLRGLYRRYQNRSSASGFHSKIGIILSPSPEGEFESLAISLRPADVSDHQRLRRWLG